MSILIKGMEMPPSNKALIMAYKDGRFIWIDLEGEKTYQYEAVEVPTPHGRLGDLDELIKHNNQYYEYLSDEFYVLVRDIENAPTVIEAEK